MHNSINAPASDKIRSQIKEKVPKSIWELFEAVATCSNSLKMNAYLVGGCVRDFLMGAKTFDWDIVVQGDGPKLGEVIANTLNGKIQKKSQFLTCTVVLGSDTKLDIATTRSEIYKYPAALPEVKKNSIDKDLFRRDFTINALAIKLNGENSFSLIDKYKGIEDLNAKLIRVLHSKSFMDDPTRAFRALRFEQRFGFTLESETNRLLKEAIETKVFDHLSGFRIFNELKRILKEKQPTRYLQRSKEIGLLQCVHTDLFSLPTGTQLLNRIEKLLQQTSTSKNRPENWKVYLLGALHSTPKKSRPACLSRLDLKGKEADFFLKSLEKIDHALIALDKTESIDSVVVYEALCLLCDEAIYVLMALAETNGVEKAISSYNNHYRKQAILKINGDDLIKLGFSPGPTFQNILKSLKKARLMENIQTKHDEIDWIQKNFTPRKD